jgi:hypothetical protein
MTNYGKDKTNQKTIREIEIGDVIVERDNGRVELWRVTAREIPRGKKFLRYRGISPHNPAHKISGVIGSTFVIEVLDPVEARKLPAYLDMSTLTMI